MLDKTTKILHYGYMDPNAKPSSPTPTGGLDPKLQETYDKVMATPTVSVNPASPGMPAPVPEPAPINPPAPPLPMPSSTEPSPASTDPNALPQPQAPVIPTEPDAQPTVSVASPQASNVTVTMDNSATQVQVKPAGKKSAKISPVILVFGGIILLIAYALIWIKVFNLTVPIINP